MIRLDDRRLYTGIATDVNRRFREHVQGGPRAARTTRSSRQLALVYQCPVGIRSRALTIEYRLKRCPKAVKEAIVERQCGISALEAILGVPEPKPLK